MHETPRQSSWFKTYLHGDLSRFMGTAVYIRFYLQNAGLYAFQFTKESDSG